MMFNRNNILASVFTVLVGIMLVPTIAGADEKPKWEELTRENGIVVHEKEIPGQDLPAFRGRGVVKASVLEVLAVLSDAERLPEWMHNCVEAKLLKEISDFERITYNRTDAPWPVDDRDVVVRAKVTVNTKKKQVVIKFKSVKDKSMPEIEDAVRMPKVHGHYILKILGDNKTHVEYMVQADPGGLLPSWLASQASKELPLITLKNLRKQVKKKRGKYEDFMKKWDPTKGGQLPEDIMK